MSTTVNETQHKYRIYDPTTSSTSNKTDLNKDTFIKLLVTQMQNQDPLNPMEDREFISQMAQFSALEQMQNLNTTMVESQAGLMEHIKTMNNNLVKSQTNIIDMLEKINKTLGGTNDPDPEEEVPGEDEVEETPAE